MEEAERADQIRKSTSTSSSNRLSLSLRFNGHFSRRTWASRYQNVSILDFIGTKDVYYGGDNWSYTTRKAPVKSSPPANQHPALYRPDAIPVARSTVSIRTERKTKWQPKIIPMYQQELVHTYERPQFQCSS